MKCGGMGVGRWSMCSVMAWMWSGEVCGCECEVWRHGCGVWGRGCRVMECVKCGGVSVEWCSM